MLTHLVNPVPKVAALGTYIELYDTAFPGYRDRMRTFIEDEVIPPFHDKVEFIAIGLATNESQSAQFVREAEAMEVDSLLVMSLGYTNSLTVVHPLISTKLPILFFNTQKTDEVRTGFSDADLLDNHGMQGIQDLTCMMVRAGRRFGIVTGLAEWSDTQEEILDHLIAARAHRRLKSCRIAAMGPPMAGMGDAQFDPDRLSEVFGIRTLDLDPSLLAKRSYETTPKEIESIRHEDLQRFEVDPEMTPEDHARSIRLEVGLRKLLEEQDLSGLTLSFDSIAKVPGIETIPFLGIIKMMGEGMAYGGEGDLFVTAGGAIAGSLCDEFNFTELYTMDFKNNAVLNSHMAECNWRMARKGIKPRLVKRQFSLAKSQPFAMLHFGLEPGEVTLIDLTLTAEGDFHFITFEGEVLDWPASEKLDRPNFKLGFRRDIRRMLNDYSLLGGGHHLNMVYGRRSRRFELLADLSGCRYSHIPTV